MPSREERAFKMRSNEEQQDRGRQYDRFEDRNVALSPPQHPSRMASCFLILFGAFEAVLTSGVVFGWAALQLMLQNEGIYASECKTTKAPCMEQAVKLEMMYTVATSAFCFCVWPTGLVLDRFGPRVCCMMGATFFGAGCAMFAVSSNTFDLFMPGYCLIAIGGLPVVLSMMHLSNLIPELAGTVITIMNVMIDVSSLDFQVFNVLVSFGFTRQTLFLAYLAVPLLIFITAPFMWPMQKYEPRPTDQENLGSRDLDPFANDHREEEQVRASWLQHAPYSTQLRSPQFLSCVAFTALQLLHVNFYIGTVDDQVEKVAMAQGGISPIEIKGMCAAFAWILPLGGLIMTFPVGQTLDNKPLWFSVMLLSVAGAVHSGLTLVPSANLQYGGFLVFAYFRAALFGTMATTVAFTFGHSNFGKLWGMLYFIAGMLNFCIGPLAYLSNQWMSFDPINYATLGVSVFLLVYPWWLWREEKKAARRELDIFVFQA
mmetsp:Transcript_9121/g.22480  ORF Transcript_9121/g.22480 Transcript_9121/m.22480 type:complete len:486 (+) Transcript_9121:54-1511(+)